MNTLRERLAIALAKKRGGSQAGLARACHVTGPSVSDWFSGKTKTMKAATLLAAARYLGVSATWLESGLGPMHAAEATILSVAEPEPRPPAWPFQSITPAQWSQLSAQQQGQVEGFAVAIMLAATTNPPRLIGNDRGH